MGLRVITPPANPPLLAPDVARQLATLPEQGEQLTALIEAATERAESYLGRALITQSLRLLLDEFPCGQLELPRPPLAEVTEIRYLDADGVQQTLDSSLYRVTTGREPAAIEPAYGATWPSTLPVAEAIEIDYTAGYGDEGVSVPASIRHAITMMVGEWLEFREGLVIGTIAEEIPNSVKYLLNGHRLGRLFAYEGQD